MEKGETSYGDLVTMEFYLAKIAQFHRGKKRGCSLGETKKSHFRFKKLHPIYLRLKAFSNDININHVFPDI